VSWAGLNHWRALAETAQAVVTIAAIIVGGIWTYHVFVRKREKYPAAQTSHQVFVLGNAGLARFLRLIVRIENLGATLLRLGKTEVQIHRVAPVPGNWGERAVNTDCPLTRNKDGEYPWPPIETMEISAENFEVEPCEAEEFHFDVWVHEDVSKLQVYSYFPNELKRRKTLGWSKTTIHDLNATGEQTMAPTKASQPPLIQRPPKASEPEPPAPPPAPQRPPKGGKS
jgi:hypothetical protein